MIKGIIYKYTSPSGKIYIGQTINEQKRRNTFLNINLRYGGLKIDNARKKYLPENFSYEVIYEEWFINTDDSISVLDEKEIYYISLYNSYKEGYNSTLGGYTSTGFYPNEETRIKMSESAKKVVHTEEWSQNISKGLKGYKQTKEHTEKINATKKRKKVNKFDLEGNLLCSYESIKEAADANHTTRNRISEVIHNIKKTYKKHIYKLAD